MTASASLVYSVSTQLSDVKCAHPDCIAMGQRLLRVHVAKELVEVGLSDVGSGLGVWTKNADGERLADPCIKNLAQKFAIGSESIDDAIERVSASIRNTLQDEASKPSSGRNSFCPHAILVDNRVCTTLTVRRGTLIGLLNVFDIINSRVQSLKPISEDRNKAMLRLELRELEAASDEPALSVKEVRQISNWKSVDCKKLQAREPRAWKHLILVSHRWNDPRIPQTPWREVQRRVLDYVREQLAKKGKDARVKVEREEDFGVWIDYFMVPTPSDSTKCEECERIKVEKIKRINALLTVATVLPMSEDQGERGWILQELTLDKHGETKLEHRDRVGLMARNVTFSQGVTPDIDDGRMLRCYEFIRLSQTPRVWPSVNLELVEKWLERGCQQEDQGGAHELLVEYARAFDKGCHSLKRLMAELTQEGALSQWEPTPTDAARPGSIENPIDLSELSSAISDQESAMRRLAELIARDDRPGLGDAVRHGRMALRSIEGMLTSNQKIGLATDWTALQKRLEGLPEGSTDPSWGLSLVPVRERMMHTGPLQWQQFVAVMMGLNAEWLYEAGLAHWVRLSAITEGLCGTKFMGRLKGGQVCFSEAAGVTLADTPRPLAKRFEYARDVSQNGVPEEDLVRLYDLASAGSRRAERPSDS